MNPRYDNDYVTLGYLNKALKKEGEKIEVNIPKNYSSPPTPPYYVNSLLLLNGQIYRCQKSRLVGSFDISDWKVVVDTDEIDESLEIIYEINKLEYVDQDDGLLETFYQEEDPSLNWTTDIEKNKHVSDLWTKDNTTQYQYKKLATNPVTYEWQKVNVPCSLFDLVDNYKQIFLTEPSNYNKEDLWLGEIIKIAIEDNELFDESDWVIRDDIIESSKIEQEEYHKIYFLPKITEINRYTSTEIKKAIDEITLTVSTTYTTKTEVNEYIDDVYNKTADVYTTKEEMTAQLAITNQAVSINTSKVETIEREMGSQQTILEQMNYLFTTKELKINNQTDPISSSYDNKGIRVYNYEILKSVLNDKGAGFETLIATGTAQLGNLKFVKSIDENGESVTDIHHLVSNIQTVEDLVGDN